MRELIRTNDAVLVSAVVPLLDESLLVALRDGREAMTLEDIYEAKLTDDDFVNIAAYVSSLMPPPGAATR